MANKITTVFDAEVRGFRDGVKKIKQDVTDAEGAVGKLKAGWKGATTEFKNSRAAQVAVGAAAVKIAKDSVEAASALEESANAVSTTYDEASGDIARLAEDAAQKYGMSQRAFNELAVAFSGFATQITGEGGNVAATVEEMATRVADFASVHNIELSDAMTKFQSALAGETEAMRRYGIDVSAAAVEQYALESGLVASKSEMTEAIKVQARYGLLMRETNQWAGDFAATSDGLANSQRILNAQIENLQAQLGQHLVPALAETTSQLNEMLAIAEDLKLIDLGAEFAKWGDLSPGGFKKRFDEVKDAATSTKFSLEDFDGTVEDLRSTLSDMGIDQDEASKAVDWYAKKVEAANTATGEQAEEVQLVAETLSDYRNKTNDAAGALEGAFDAGVDVNEMLADQAEAAEDASDEVKTLADEFAGLLGVLDAQERAGDTADMTAREQAAAARDAEGAVADLKREVIAYGDEIGGIPPETVSDIIALIDQGSLDQAKAELDALERMRQVRLNVTTYYSSVGSSSTPVQPNRGGPRALGGPTSPNTMYPILEKGESEILEENGKAFLLSANNGQVTPLSGASGGGATGGGITMAPGAIQVTAIGAPTPELERLISQSIDNWNRRNGRTR